MKAFCESREREREREKEGWGNGLTATLAVRPYVLQGSRGLSSQLEKCVRACENKRERERERAGLASFAAAVVFALAASSLWHSGSSLHERSSERASVLFLRSFRLSP